MSSLHLTGCFLWRDGAISVHVYGRESTFMSSSFCERGRWSFSQQIKNDVPGLAHEFQVMDTGKHAQHRGLYPDGSVVHSWMLMGTHNKISFKTPSTLTAAGWHAWTMYTTLYLVMKCGQCAKLVNSRFVTISDLFRNQANIPRINDSWNRSLVDDFRRESQDV